MIVDGTNGTKTTMKKWLNRVCRGVLWLYGLMVEKQLIGILGLAVNRNEILMRVSCPLRSSFFISFRLIFSLLTLLGDEKKRKV